MNRRRLLSVSAATALGLALLAGNAVAQSAKDLVGTWTPVSVEAFGPNPKGNLTFDTNGRFSLQLLRADLKKVAANKRDMGTPEENKAIVQGSIAYFGTYSIDDATHVLTVNIEGSTFPNFTGGTQTRILSFDGDEVTYFNPTPSMGGSAKVTYRRTK